MEKFETERLVIREFVLEDAAALQEIFGDPEVMRCCEPAYTIDKTRQFLEEFCIGRKGALAAVGKDTGMLIGYLLCKSLGEDPARDVYELGWIFRRDCWRQGYAYEACRALVEYVFTGLGAHKVMAEAIDSVKSVGLMKKLGMVQEGLQRRHTLDNDGNYADFYLYGMLREEWAACPIYNKMERKHEYAR